MYPISTVQQRKLTKLFISYSPGTYRWREILPARTNVPMSGKIPIYGKEHLKIITAPTSPRIPAPEIFGSASLKSFDLEPFRRKMVVTDDEMADYDLPLSPVEDATRMMKEHMEATRELILADWMTDATNFTNTKDVDGDTAWNAASGAGAAIRSDIAAAKADVGKVYNLVFAMTLDVYLAVIQAVQDDLLGFREDPLDLKALARHLMVDRCVILDAQYNSGGTETPVWGTQNAWLIVQPDNGNQSRECFGFSMTRDERVWAKRIPDDDPEGYKILTKWRQANVIADETKAYYFYTCL